ncbi:MAG: CotH kinase family protein [Candidatus Lokiarchaeota archaeon]|nr:CotH kinase family protein [Candidatus Lokiarchaeota archaeon]
MTNDELDKSDKNKDGASEKKVNYNFAQQLRNKMTQIEQVEKGRREAEEKKAALAKEIREKKPLPLSKDLKSKSNGFITGSFEKLKPSKLKRELIPFLFISIITFSSLIYFTYQDSSGSIAYSPEIPIINIEVSSEITNIPQQCFLKFSPVSLDILQSNWANRNLAANIRKRDSDGGFSFELSRRESLFKMRDDDDWLLLPPGKNLDSFRTKMAFDVYNMLKENDTSYMLPQSQLVEVYVNGDYQGMYLLSERIDRKLMNLEQENIVNPPENDAIFKITNWDGDFFTIPNSMNSPWEQLYPNSFDFSQIPINLTQFIHNTSEENFFNEENGIFTILDKGELIDNLLFGLLVGHESIEGSSYYLIYNQLLTSGFFFLPWDFGQSWGYSKDGSIPNDLWLNDITNEIESVCWSKLYNRLLFPNNSSINDEFVSEIKDRWSYIRTNLLKFDDFSVYFNSLYSKIQPTLLRTTSGYDFIEYFADNIESWISTRLNLLDDIFSEPNTIFNDNFEPPFREDDKIFGFSDSAARRHYYHSSIIFSKDRIHNVNITIREDFLTNIIDRKYDYNWETEHIWMASDVSIDGYSIDNVGFRLKANLGSLNTPKNSFKLKFSESELYTYDGRKVHGEYHYYPENIDRRFLGIKNLNLRAGPGDLSLLNEPIGQEIFKITGNPYLRISWAKLYITLTDENGNIVKSQEYKGLYWMTEHLDKTFLRTRFKNPNGNLYKTTGATALLNNWYVTENPDDLKILGTMNPPYRRTYELKTNQEIDDYTDLRDFLYIINNQWENIEYTTNLSILAKYFASSIYQGSWDDYPIIAHNYYLYSEPTIGFVMIPWDIENNLNAVSYFFGDFSDAPLLNSYQDHFNWSNWESWIGDWSWDPKERPLWDNAIKDPAFVKFYLSEIENIMNKTTYLLEKVEEWLNLITEPLLLPFTATTPTEASIYGLPYTMKIDYSSFLEEKSRVINFLEDRKEFVEDQLNLLSNLYKI